jgi:hypothetical protein
MISKEDYWKQVDYINSMKSTVTLEPKIIPSEKFTVKIKSTENIFSRIWQMIVTPFTWIFFGYIKIK